MVRINTLGALNGFQIDLPVHFGRIRDTMSNMFQFVSIRVLNNALVENLFVVYGEEFHRYSLGSD